MFSKQGFQVIESPVFQFLPLKFINEVKKTPLCQQKVIRQILYRIEVNNMREIFHFKFVIIKR